MAKKNKKTGRFEKKESPAGIPGGWSVNPDIPDKPGETKAPNLPKVIKVSHPVEKNSYEKNVQEMVRIAKRLQKDGTMPIISPKMTTLLDAEAKKSKVSEKTSKKVKAKKDNDSDQD